MSNMITDYLTQTQAAFSSTVNQSGKVIPISIGSFLFKFITEMVPTDDSIPSRIIKSLVDGFKILFVVNLAK